MTPGLYGLEGFEKCGIYYYLTGITGILLWMEISEIIDSSKFTFPLLIKIGKNTKYIMIFHLFGFFILNCIFYFCYSMNMFNSFLSNFDVNSFFSNIYYSCTYEPRLIIVYLFFGISIPLLYSSAKEKICEILSKN